jgi:hypothetical protein
MQYRWPLVSPTEMAKWWDASERALAEDGMSSSRHRPPWSALTNLRNLVILDNVRTGCTDLRGRVWLDNCKLSLGGHQDLSEGLQQDVSECEAEQGKTYCISERAAGIPVAKDPHSRVYHNVVRM